jgi:hypothetical protein
MIISHHHRFVFIKTRKTAGSTLEQNLYPKLGKMDICTGSERDGTPAQNVKINTDGHVGYKFLEQTNKGALEKYFVFTIERNPWDKVVSSYFWHQKIKPTDFAFLSFEEYMSKQHNLWPTDWGKYAKGNEVLVDKVYKYEEMIEMYEDLNDRFNLRINPEQAVNVKLKADVRKVKDYRELHTPKTIDIVNRMFHKEILEFGYTYE